MAKQRTYLVAYGLTDNPLGEDAQERLENDADWVVEHLFYGVWIVRTYLKPEFVAAKFSKLLRFGTSVVVVPLSRKRPVHSAGVWPRQLQNLPKFLAPE